MLEYREAAHDPKQTLELHLNNRLKLALGIAGFVAGLYLISFHSDSNLFFLGLLLGIWGGLTIRPFLYRRD